MPEYCIYVLELHSSHGASWNMFRTDCTILLCCLLVATKRGIERWWLITERCKIEKDHRTDCQSMWFVLFTKIEY